MCVREEQEKESRETAARTHLEDNHVVLRVLHAVHEERQEVRQVRIEHLVAHRVLGEREPKLARLQSHVNLRVARPSQKQLA